MRKALLVPSLALFVVLTGCSAIGDRFSGAMEGWLRSDDLTGISNEDLEATIRVVAQVAARLVATRFVDAEALEPSPAPAMTPIFLVMANGVELPAVCTPRIVDRCRSLAVDDRIIVRESVIRACAPEHAYVNNVYYTTCLYVEALRVRSKQ